MPSTFLDIRTTPTTRKPRAWDQAGPVSDIDVRMDDIDIDIDALIAQILDETLTPSTGYEERLIERLASAASGFRRGDRRGWAAMHRAMGISRAGSSVYVDANVLMATGAATRFLQAARFDALGALPKSAIGIATIPAFNTLAGLTNTLAGIATNPAFNTLAGLTTNPAFNTLAGLTNPAAGIATNPAFNTLAGLTNPAAGIATNPASNTLAGLTNPAAGIAIWAAGWPSSAQGSPAPLLGAAEETPQIQGSRQTRYPNLMRAFHDGRVTGRNKPRPENRQLRAFETLDSVGESDQVAFGRAGDPPAEHVRRPHRP